MAHHRVRSTVSREMARHRERSTVSRKMDHYRERSTVSKEMASKTYSTLSEQQQEKDQGCGPFDARMQPVVKLYKIDQCVESRLQVNMNSPDSARGISIKQEEPEDHQHFNILHMVVCKEEDYTEQERSPRLLQEEPEPPRIKQEQEELLLSDGPMLTLLAVKSEVDDQDISSHCCEVNVELESHIDDWQETSGGVRAQSSQSLVFSCSECSYALTSQVFLHKHIRRRHFDLYCQMLRNGQITSSACQQGTRKPVIATKRGHDTQKRQQLKKTHCNQCDKTFGLAGKLKRHQLQVHNVERPRPYHCTQCDESFNWPSSLSTHERIHTLERKLSVVTQSSSLCAAFRACRSATFDAFV